MVAAPFSPRKDLQSAGQAEPLPALDERAIMTAAGEVAYEWTIASDTLRLDANAAEVLGPQPARVTTGRAFAELLDPQARETRQEAILNARTSDDGAGVRFEVKYAILPDGMRGHRLIVEDVGRWYADARGQPARAVGIMRVINERHEREQRLMFLSRYDDLTGYLNRTALFSALGDALNAALRTSTPVAFMLVGIDRFRAINEAYGYEAADEIFATLAHRIRASLRDGDAIGRFTGNRLGIVLRNCSDAEIPAAAARFQSIARSDFVVTRGGAAAITVSIGAVALPKYGRNVNEAMAHAQEALHIARATGLCRFIAYAPSAEAGAAQTANAARSLAVATALKEYRLALAYRPAMTAGSRRVAFAEAILRVDDRTKPAPMGASTDSEPFGFGLTRVLDERAVQLIVAALARVGTARLMVNLSAETVSDESAREQVLARLGSRRELAARMIVAVPGQSLSAHGGEGRRFVRALHDLGCQVAVSARADAPLSIAALREDKVDLVRFDMTSNGRVADGGEFLRALVALGHAIGAKVVADGVRDETSARTLTDWGVDYLQGPVIGEAAVADHPPAADTTD